MEEKDKLNAFFKVVDDARHRVSREIQEFLMRENPSIETAEELKSVMENSFILSEMDAYDFLDAWIDYKKRLKESVETIHKESVSAQFEALITKNFKRAS